MSLYSGIDAFSQHDDNNDESDFYRCLSRIDLLFQQVYLQRNEVVPAYFSPFFFPAKIQSAYFNDPYDAPAWFAFTPLPDSREALTTRLKRLIEQFDLTLFERDLLLVCLLPRLSTHYNALPDSGIKEGVSDKLLMQMFSSAQTEYQLLLSALHPSSPLFQFSLLLKTTVNENKIPTTFYMCSESVWHFLCGNGSMAKYRYPYPQPVETDAMTLYPVTISEQICCLCLNPVGETPPVIVLDGCALDGRENGLANILAQHQRALWRLDICDLDNVVEPQQQQVIVDIIRDALMDNAGVVCVRWADAGAAKKHVVSVLERLLPQVRLPLFFLTDSTAESPLFHTLPSIHFSVPCPDAMAKSKLLQMAWPRQSVSENQRLQTLAERYAFSLADISLLIAEADYYRQIRGQDALLGAGDLQKTLLYRSRKNFGNLAHRITPVRTFDDIVLSPSVKKQMEEILAAIRLRESVTIKHFAHKTGGKKGLSALFYGEPGTGKTLAAEVLAQHLDTDLIKVDLSAVVSKYVGETEKNLSLVFDLAETDSGILFFDEADALFGKRSESKDAHDRYANIEVSYLLQRLENYPGFVILATNHRGHLDTAFSRRFTFITHFTYPDVTLRTQMWQAIWPATLALAEDVDFAELAIRGNLTGASICNVALLAAVLAADEQSDKIQLRHIDHAIRRELNKLGRLPL
ncbi:ATP-binding protein [Kosakonia sp. ML.JS2a]|uniref:ATP-binding protein n=1 Tax=Kosakonia sp. ML.JS2a TaxID=2980557 RepID=UPI0021D99F99|nr:ATP-binding protein [Kosakonia sp. ML.JS2a]UXY12414.1 ATP-binding protein [Kosakonia sp. ML.JS2a]